MSLTVADNGGSQGNLFQEFFGGDAGLVFLEKIHDGAHDHHGGNDNAVDRFSHYKGNAGYHHEKNNQGVGEVVQKFQEGVFGLKLLERIGAVLEETGGMG